MPSRLTWADFAIARELAQYLGHLRVVGQHALEALQVVHRRFVTGLLTYACVETTWTWVWSIFVLEIGRLAPLRRDEEEPAGEHDDEDYSRRRAQLRPGR